MKTQPNCPHHWVISEHYKNKSVAICKLCDAEAEFDNAPGPKHHMAVSDIQAEAEYKRKQRTTYVENTRFSW